ncbi:MFS transporter [Galactobacter caseinivorans]|nr:MFS transporter [Galactobacter caseinivorans]
MSRMFASLSERNYRVWFAGGLVSNVGTWMQRIAQDWLVLTQLTDHSGTATGLVTGLQFLPILLLSPYAGLIADRMSKLRLLKITQAGSMFLALLLGVLVLTNTAQLWHVYVIATALGIVAAFDGPPRQALVNDLVPRSLVPNAVSLNSTSFNLARLAGPGVAGLLIAAVGTGWLFLINAASYVAVLIALAALKEKTFFGTGVRTPRAKGQVREGIAYVLASPTLILIFVMAFMVGTFGLNFQIFNAVMSTTVFHRGPADYGILGTIMAIGTLAGALLAARRQGSRVKYAVAGALLAGAFMIAAAWAPSFWVFAALLVPTGLASITFLNSANVTVQMSVDPAFRGRVMALYMMVLQGGTPLGAPLMGWIAEHYGARASLTVAGVLTVLVAVWGIFYWSRHHRGELGTRLRQYGGSMRQRVRLPRKDDPEPDAA